MKRIHLIIFSLLLLSCNDSSKKNSHTVYQTTNEKCTTVEIGHLLTHGFSQEMYDSVIVQTFKKNSNFDSLIREYIVQLDETRDTLRQERFLDLSDEITSGSDLRIIFNDSITFEITEIKTEWVALETNTSTHDECWLVYHKLNGVPENNEGGIGILKEPSFIYPWESN